MADKKTNLQEDEQVNEKPRSEKLKSAAEKEFKRLKNLYHKKGEDGKKKLAIDKNKFDALLGLMKQTAFMSAQLDALAEELYEVGVVEEYKNGQNQFGKKESTQSKSYNAIIKNYITAIKTLADCTPEAEIKDELMEFLKGRKK